MKTDELRKRLLLRADMAHSMIKRVGGLTTEAGRTFETDEKLFRDAAEALSEKTPINKFGAPITVTSTEPQSDSTLPGGLFPKTELSDEFATIYVTFREIKDGDVAKTVQRTVAACCDYDAAGKLIGVEIFDVLPEPA